MKENKPWGQNQIRFKAMELLKNGQVAPSQVLANVLILSQKETLDQEDLELMSVQKKPLSEQANRVIANYLQKMNLPGAKKEELINELMNLSWVNKKPISKPTKPDVKPSSHKSGAGKPVKRKKPNDR